MFRARTSSSSSRGLAEAFFSDVVASQRRLGDELRPVTMTTEEAADYDAS